MLSAWLIVAGVVGGGPCSALIDGPVEYAGRSDFVVHDVGEPFVAVVRAGEAAEAKLGDLPVFAVSAEEGQVVADIGFGSGGHVFQLAERVGSDGRVVCREVDSSQVARLRERAQTAGVMNLDIEVSDFGDVGIEEQTLDIALLADVYNIVVYQKATKRAFVESVFDAMKPGGVVVVGYVGTGMLQHEPSRGPTVDQTIRDFMEAGFEPGMRYEFVEEQHRPMVLEFRRPRDK